MGKRREDSIRAEAAFRVRAEEDGVVVVGAYVRSKTPVECVCAEGHTCQPRPSDIKAGIGWCSVCAGNDKVTARNNFLEFAKSANVIVVGEYVGAGTPVECFCSNGHKCQPRPSDVRRGTGWCRICAGNSPIVAEAEFRARAEEDGVTIVGAYAGANVPVVCICSKGHQGAPRPDAIRRGQGWCWTCSGTEPKGAKARFLSAAEEAGVTVIGEYTFNRSTVECICPNGHKCNVRPEGIQQGEGWCQQCVIRFDRVYLIVKDFGLEQWAKVGIASSDSRVKDHINNGWILYRQWLDLDHYKARRIETAVKKESAEFSWPNLDPKHLPKAGYTETFPKEYLGRVERRIDKLVIYGDT